MYVLVFLEVFYRDVSLAIDSVPMHKSASVRREVCQHPVNVVSLNVNVERERVELDVRRSVLKSPFSVCKRPQRLEQKAVVTAKAC